MFGDLVSWLSSEAAANSTVDLSWAARVDILRHMPCRFCATINAGNDKCDLIFCVCAIPVIVTKFQDFMFWMLQLEDEWN